MPLDCKALTSSTPLPTVSPSPLLIRLLLNLFNKLLLHRPLFYFTVAAIKEKEPLRHDDFVFFFFYVYRGIRSKQAINAADDLALGASPLHIVTDQIMRDLAVQRRGSARD